MDTESCLANNLPTSFVSIDFEYIEDYENVCSIGMAKYINGQLCEKYYKRVCPPESCHPSNEKYLEHNGKIRLEELNSEKRFNELFPEIESFIDGLPLVAYNSSTERECFSALVELYDLSTSIDYDRILDPYAISFRVETSLGCYRRGKGLNSLDSVCRRNGVNVLDKHHALNDAIMCGDLFLKLTQVIKEHNWDVTTFTKPKITEPRTLNGQIAEKIKQQKYDKKDLIPNKNIDSIKENEFKNKYIALAGISYDLTSQYASRLINCGAHIVDKVTEKTNILIVGNKPGPKKMKDAEKNGVEIMSEFEMLEILNHFEDGM